MNAGGFRQRIDHDYDPHACAKPLKRFLFNLGV
jgi:hypothetical protein